MMAAGIVTAGIVAAGVTAAGVTAAGVRLRNVADEVVLINAFEVPAAGAEAFIAAWEQARDYLRTQPGYIDTALHQAVTPGADFEFVNIARWKTSGDFTAAVRNQEFQQAAAGLSGYRSHPALYRPVRT